MRKMIQISCVKKCFKSVKVDQGYDELSIADFGILGQFHAFYPPKPDPITPLPDVAMMNFIIRIIILDQSSRVSIRNKKYCPHID